MLNSRATFKLSGEECVLGYLKVCCLSKCCFCCCLSKDPKKGTGILTMLNSLSPQKRAFSFHRCHRQLPSRGAFLLRIFQHRKELFSDVFFTSLLSSSVTQRASQAKNLSVIYLLFLHGIALPSSDKHALYLDMCVLNFTVTTNLQNALPHWDKHSTPQNAGSSPWLSSFPPKVFLVSRVSFHLAPI